MVASAPRTRLIYEPANVRQRLYLDGEPRLAELPLSGPDDDLGADGIALQRAASGAFRSSWTEQMNRARRPERRVIKDVRTVGVLPWFTATMPDVPTVLLLRHPLAVAHSILELGWSTSAELLDPESGVTDPVLRARIRSRALLVEVGQWAAHHSWAMSHVGASSVHVIFYEDLVEDPRGELDRLGNHVGRFHETWRTWTPDPASIARPSATSFRRSSTANAATWIETWTDRYDAETLDEAMAILGAYGMDRLYAMSPRPLLSATDAIAAMASGLGPMSTER